MSSHDDYKSSKEAFVSGMTGSSVTHINLISLAALVRTILTLNASRNPEIIEP